MGTKIKLTLVEREGRYDVRVSDGAESDWERLDMVLQKLQADDLLFYCGRQHLRNRDGACRFMLTLRMKSDRRVRALHGDQQRLAILQWLTRKVNE